MAAGWKLGALLKELRQGRLHDMSDQVAGASDYLWSDAQLCRYINEAARRFARQSLCIRDATSSITKFATIDSTATNPWTLEYALDPSICAVISVRMGRDPVTGVYDQADLARAGHDGFSTYHQPDRYFFNPSTLSNLPPGKPLAWGTDEFVTADTNGSFSVMNLRLYPATNPTYAGMSGQMRVCREPLADLTIQGLDAYPEIPASHHLDIIDWAAYLALSTADLDVAGADAVKRAQDFHDKFEATCVKAKNEFMRKMFSNLQWGFGSNGWTWETYP